jgi:hypothetical protein
MNKIIKPWKLANKFESLNIEINDNKHMINTFEGQFTKFLLRNKGTTFNNKDELLIILNDKPRTFLIRLQLLINKLHINLKKNYSKNIQNKLTKNYHHLQTRIQSRNVDFANNNMFININKINKNNLTFNNKMNSQIISVNDNLNCLINEKIQNKIKNVEDLLINNTLPIPVNLLKPLLNTNMSNYLNNKNNFNYLDRNINLNSKVAIANSDNLQKQSKAFVNKPHFIQSLLNQWLQIPIGSQNMNHPDSSTITLLKNKIKNYTDNNLDILNMNITQYFELITPQKKVNPFTQNIVYNFNKYNNTNWSFRASNIFTLLEYAFKSMSCLISKPQYVETPQKLVIQLFYFFIAPNLPLGPVKANKFKKNFNNLKTSLPIATEVNGIKIADSCSSNNNLTKMNKDKDKIWAEHLLTQKNINKLNKLCTILSKIFNKPVTLDLIPLSVPFFDENILVKSLGILSKTVSVVNIINLVFGNIILYSKNEASYVYNYSITKSFLSGAKIKIGGRLMTQKVVPRISSRIIQKGSIAPSKVTFSNWSRLTLKNKRGSHSLTVILSQMM